MNKSEWEIVPGRSVGPFSLGETLNDVLEKLQQLSANAEIMYYQHDEVDDDGGDRDKQDFPDEDQEFGSAAEEVVENTADAGGKFAKNAEALVLADSQAEETSTTEAEGGVAVVSALEESVSEPKEEEAGTTTTSKDAVTAQHISSSSSSGTEPLVMIIRLNELGVQLCFDAYRQQLLCIIVWLKVQEDRGVNKNGESTKADTLVHSGIDETTDETPTSTVETTPIFAGFGAGEAEGGEWLPAKSRKKKSTRKKKAEAVPAINDSSTTSNSSSGATQQEDDNSPAFGREEGPSFGSAHDHEGDEGPAAFSGGGLASPAAAGDVLSSKGTSNVAGRRLQKPAVCFSYNHEPFFSLGTDLVTKGRIQELFGCGWELSSGVPGRSSAVFRPTSKTLGSAASDLLSRALTTVGRQAEKEHEEVLRFPEGLAVHIEGARDGGGASSPLSRTLQDQDPAVKDEIRGEADIASRLWVLPGHQQMAPEAEDLAQDTNKVLQLEPLPPRPKAIARLRIGVQIQQPARVSVIRLGATCQDVLSELGCPDDVDEDEAGHHFYAYQYHQRGVDAIFCSKSHWVTQIRLHTNLPEHPLFGKYERCFFELDGSGFLGRPCTIDPSWKMRDVLAKNAKGSCMRRIPQPAFATTTYYWEKEGAAFEVLDATGGIASVTLFRILPR
ncbi:unnamed protein product [Amoebophrya sp. A120]|nr:unnamed protein product [Amoebophrya sp. A120]|eukprot:GSA120T00020165001.1